MGDSSELQQQIDEWLRWDKNEATRNEIKKYVEGKDWTQLEKILCKRISFGTAGLRGRMAAGYACMNDLVIVQTAQGFLEYLENYDLEHLKTKGIVLGYDGRHNSKRFAELTAAVFLNKNYPVILFSDYVITPFVPFAITQYGCIAGVMVTASHNPKDDNGYKVYGSNGSQIVSPADKDITKCILRNLEPRASSWDTTILKNHPLLRDELKDSTDRYMQVLSESILEEHRANNIRTELKFAYTAMHGVGYPFIVQAMDLIGLKMVPVQEQIKPDPEFPTVKFPNPEEGKSSLDLSIKTADANGCKVILANDPDADRLAVAEKTEGGNWKVFTGNEIATLLGWWLLQIYKNANPDKKLDNVYMLASTVSSKILRTFARAEGFNFIETLTGFKWMGNKADELIKQGKTVVFAFEEAIGFMCGTSVLDKDGVSAAAHMACLSTYLYKNGITLNQKLDEIFKEYGYHLSNNSYYICYDTDKINTIFERIRNFDGKNTYPKDILMGKYTIHSTRDLTTGYDDTQPDKKAILPVSKSSQMITFEFTNGLVVTLRTSGTEPKIKYYSELCAPPGQTNRKDIENVLNEMVQAIVNEFLQPKENELIPKAD